eukprot:5074223-Pleurochrysis_carterae.AAC.1
MRGCVVHGVCDILRLTLLDGSLGHPLRVARTVLSTTAATDTAALLQPTSVLPALKAQPQPPLESVRPNLSTAGSDLNTYRV